MHREFTPTYLDPEVAKNFAADPFATLAGQSRALFDVYHDPALDEVARDARLDGYFRTIAELDRATFPDTESVQSGVPLGYIPDGFIDMGRVANETPAKRHKRPMNYVDTYGILHAHKDMFARVFSGIDPTAFEGVRRGDLMYTQTILKHIGYEIWSTMPHGEPEQVELGGILPVHEAAHTECQQHALVAQVLMQAFGIRSRLSKNNVAFPEDAKYHGSVEQAPGGDHVSNVVTMTDDGQEALFMFDATNPQVDKQGNGQFGLFRMKEEDRLNDASGYGHASWMVTTMNGQKRKYKEFPDLMHWKIARAASPAVATHL